jgi:hypothetical protein
MSIVNTVYKINRRGICSRKVQKNRDLTFPGAAGGKFIFHSGLQLVIIGYAQREVMEWLIMVASLWAAVRPD